MPSLCEHRVEHGMGIHARSILTGDVTPSILHILQIFPLLQAKEKMEDWEGLDLDDSDLPSLLRPSPSLLPSKRPPTNDHHNHDQQPKRTVSLSSASPPPPPPPQPQTQTISLSLPSLQPCSQIPLQSSSHNASTAQQPRSPHLLDESKDSSRRRIPGPAGSVQAAMHRGAVRAEICAPVSGCQEEDDHDEDFKINPWLCALDFLGLDAKTPLPYSIRMSQTMERIPQVVGVIKSCRPNGLGDLIVTMKDPTGTIGASIHQKVLAENKFASDITVDSVVVLQQVVAFSPTHSLRYLNVTINNVVKVFSKESRPPNHRFPYSSVARRSPEAVLETRSGMAATPIIRQETNEIINVVAKGVETDFGRANGRVSQGSLGCGRDKAPVVEEPDHEACGRRKKPISRAPLPDWTDEQLAELFADCSDDIIHHSASKINICRG